MGQIYLVRHGQASFGSQNYDQLSELGYQQAQHLGRWFDQSGLLAARVVAGSMKRHQQTAQACMAELPAGRQPASEWQIDAGFNEYDHHEVLVKHVPAFEDPAEVKRFLSTTPNAKAAFQSLFQESMARWMDGRHDAEYGESWPAFRQRCIAALERQINHADPAKSIVVFTSGGTIATLCQYALGIPDRNVAELNWSLVNSAVTKLMFQSGQPPGKPGRLSLSYLNNFAHLEHLNAPNNITYR
ncbi:histidine phosphatase family protein [Undibacterium sp.]|jgi:broad specificity phosphatase PhoE|uniref:histidine phosphatase family protein n=1 Tax=Undibacterium sp. TaxID=1914977 RepID=UPI002C93248F|nr:histidine phosphatase family protein [Undibacterium sp.]HTD04981.1 histidine phosphatase family protein [Undibacterium sp.]